MKIMKIMEVLKIGKKLLVIMLVCLNVALMLALLASATPAAEAQAYGRSGQYLVITSQIRPREDGLHIIDVSKGLLATWEFDRGSKRLENVGVRQLDADFNRGPAER